MTVTKKKPIKDMSLNELIALKENTDTLLDYIKRCIRKKMG